MATKIQGGIVIRRLRTGQTLYAYFKGNGNPLFQCIDSANGEIKPDWTESGSQPSVTMCVETATGGSLTPSSCVWYHDGSEITSSNEAFEISGTGDSTLTIVQNLASKSNLANDTISCTATVEVEGVEYTVTKETTVTIQPAGNNAYYGYIDATSNDTVLNNASDTVELTASLYYVGDPVADLKVKWYKGSNESEANLLGTDNPITIGTGTVDGTTLIVCDFYTEVNGTSSKVDGEGIYVTDTTDPYDIRVTADGSVSENTPVTVTARLWKNTENGGEAVSWGTDSSGNAISKKVSWAHYIYRGTDYKLKTSATSDVTSTTSHTYSIEVSTTHTDDADGVHDVNVLFEAQFEI